MWCGVYMCSTMCGNGVNVLMGIVCVIITHVTLHLATCDNHHHTSKPLASVCCCPHKSHSAYGLVLIVPAHAVLLTLHLISFSHPSPLHIHAHTQGTNRRLLPLHYIIITPPHTATSTPPTYTHTSHQPASQPVSQHV